MSVRRISDAEFDQASYDLGYAEGERSRSADIAAAFDELCDVPDGVDIWDPWSVAKWVHTLQEP